MRHLIVCSILVACGRTELDGVVDAGTVDLECHPGGPMRVLASDPHGLGDIFVDHDEVYVAGNGTIYAVPRTGGALRSLTPDGDLAPGHVHATASDLVYLTTGHTIARVAKATGERTLVDLAAHGHASAFTLQADDVWAITADGTVIRVPKGGAAIDVMSSTPTPTEAIVATSTRVYVIPDNANKPLVRLTADGTTLGSIPPPEGLYAVGEGPNGIHGFGAHGVAYLADDSSAFEEELPSGNALLLPLSSDDTCLYVASRVPNMPATIECLHHDGTTDVLVDGLAFPGGIALDAACMYVTDTLTVFRLPRP